MIKAAMRFKNVRRVGQTRRFRTGHVMHNKMLFRAKQFSDSLICPTLYIIRETIKKGNTKSGRGMENFSCFARDRGEHSKIKPATLVNIFY